MEPNLLCVQDTASCIITIDFDKYSKVVLKKISNRYINSIFLKLDTRILQVENITKTARFHMILKFVMEK